MADNLSNTCEGTSGTTVSISNSTGPSQLDVVTLSGTGSTQTWDNAHAHSGATAMKLSCASTIATLNWVGWTTQITPTPVANAFCRFYMYLTAYPTVNTVLFKFLGTAVPQATARMALTTGLIALIDEPASVVATTTAAPPLNSWCRIELDCTANSGTTASLALRIFSGANLETSTPDSGGSVSGAGRTTTSLVDASRFGISTSATETSLFNMWYDDLAFSDTSTPGPSVRSPLTVTLLRPPVPLLVPGQILGSPPSAPPTHTGLLAGTGSATSGVIIGVTASLAGSGSATESPAIGVTAALAGTGQQFPITEDASAPAAVHNLASTTATATTASFSPPAGSLVVTSVYVGLQGTSATMTMAVSDSNSVAYTAGPFNYAFSANGVWYFTHYYQTAPGSITLTATRGSTSTGFFGMDTLVLTGVTAGQAGAASNSANGGSVTSMTGAVTPTALNGWVLSATCSNALAAAATGLTQDSSFHDGTDGALVTSGHRPTSALTSETIGWNATAGAFYVWAALEIIAASASSGVIIGVTGAPAGTGLAAVSSETIGVTGALAGTGSAASGAIIGVTAQLAGTGSASAVSGTALQAAAILAGTGSLTSGVAIGVTGSPAGAGSASAVPVIGVTAALAGAGSAAESPAIGVTGALAGTGSAASGVIIGVTSQLAGTGSIASGAIIGVTAALAGTGSATAVSGAAAAPAAVNALVQVQLPAPAIYAIGSSLVATQTPSAPATVSVIAALAGTGSAQAGTGVTIGVTAALAGAGSIAESPVIAVTAALMAGTGSAASAVAIGVTGSPAGTGSAASGVIIGVTAQLAGAGSITASAGNTVLAAAILAGTGQMTSGVIIGVTASLAGSGQASSGAAIRVTAALNGSGQVLAVATIGVTASLAGSGQATAGSASFWALAASLAGSGSAQSAVALQLTTALAGAGAAGSGVILLVPAGLAGLGALRATGKSVFPNIPGSGGSATLTDPRDGSATVADPREATAGVTDTRDGLATVTDPSPVLATVTDPRG